MIQAPTNFYSTSSFVHSSDAKLRKTAQDLETSFLSEMLKHAGVGVARDAFGGGVGEEQFASFLREEQARGMVKAGGIGLAEALFHSLNEVRNAE